MEIVHSARFDTPFGEMLAASTAQGLAYLQLPRASGRGFTGWLRRFAPDAAHGEALAPNRSSIGQILEYLQGKREKFDLELDLRGTEFELASGFPTARRRRIPRSPGPSDARRRSERWGAPTLRIRSRW
jgi:hypothetical protein